MSHRPKPRETFAQWFARQRFRNFSAREVESYFSRTKKGRKNSRPPRYLWHRIVPTLRLVDNLRDHFGRACAITSSYRSPAYNRACDSSNPPDPRALLGPGSQHPRFTALDIRISGVSASRVYAVLLSWRRSGKYVGGLGLYVGSRFVHIDTRPRNATWRGN